MDRRIRQVAGILTVLLLAVALSAGYVQGLASESIANRTGTNPAEPAVNRFRIFQECQWERGAILSIDGVELARSDPLPPGQRCNFERVYPDGALAPHVLGQWSLHFGKTGLEATYNQELVGEPAQATSFLDLLERRPRIGNTLVTTIDTRLQRAALQALDGRRGGVVLMNPRTGAVLAAASVPTYDPNPLASNNRTAAVRARCEMGIGIQLGDDGQPLVDEAGDEIPCYNPHTPLISVALQGRRPPGSAFKVVAAAAALESGRFTPSSSFPVTRSYLAPGDTRAIGNYGGGSCGGTLANALRVSCNTAFAQLSVDVGAEQLLTTAHAMGLDRIGGAAATEFVGCEAEAASDVRETRTGCLPAEFREGDRVESIETAGFRARAGFGQWVLQVSPFGMALVAGTIANDGFVPRPRFADRVIGGERGELVREVRAGVGAAALSTETASQLADMMHTAVRSGTGARAFSGFPIPVAGKTGTAQQGPFCNRQEAEIFGFIGVGEQLDEAAARARLSRCGGFPHAWFMAFAPVEDPAVAVAVLMERGAGVHPNATGGQHAAPIARAVLERYFELYPASADE